MKIFEIRKHSSRMHTAHFSERVLSLEGVWSLGGVVLGVLYLEECFQ